MYQNHEIIAYAITLVLLLSLLVFRKKLARLPKWKILVSSFAIFACACLAKILRIFACGDICLALEHFCIALSALILAVWCWKVLMGERVWK